MRVVIRIAILMWDTFFVSVIKKWDRVFIKQYLIYFMKKIEAIIRESKFNEVKEVLIKLGVRGMTTYDVRGRGSQIGQTVPSDHPSSAYADDLVPKRKIEIVCIDEEVSKIVNSISMHARTDLIGDGKIFISEIIDVIKIRTEEKGQKAV